MLQRNQGDVRALDVRSLLSRRASLCNAAPRNCSCTSERCVKFSQTVNGGSEERPHSASFLLSLYCSESERPGQTCLTGWVYKVPAAPAALVLFTHCVTKMNIFLNIQSTKPFVILTDEVVISATSGRSCYYSLDTLIKVFKPPLTQP